MAISMERGLLLTLCATSAFAVGMKFYETSTTDNTLHDEYASAATQQCKGLMATRTATGECFTWGHGIGAIFGIGNGQGMYDRQLESVQNSMKGLSLDRR